RIEGSKIAQVLPRADAAGGHPGEQADVIRDKSRAAVAHRYVDAVGMSAACGHVGLSRGGRSQAVAGRIARPTGIFGDRVAIAIIALRRVGRDVGIELITEGVVVKLSAATIDKGHRRRLDPGTFENFGPHERVARTVRDLRKAGAEVEEEGSPALLITQIQG